MRDGDEFIFRGILGQRPLQESCGKGIQDIHGWVEPFCQLFIGSLRLMESLDLLMNEGENGAGRVASLELGGEWVCKKIALCALFVRLQGIIEN